MATLTVNSGGGADYTSITAAEVAAADGDTIHITGGGPYNEQVTVTTPNLTLTASADVVIDGQDTRDHCIEVDTGGDNFTVNSEKSGTTYGGYLTLRGGLSSQIVFRVDGCTARKVNIDDGDGDSVVQGIAIRADNWLVEYCDISGQAQHCIYPQIDNDGGIIRYNYLHDTTLDCIRLLGTNMQIYGNILENPGNHCLTIQAEAPYLVNEINIWGNTFTNPGSFCLTIIDDKSIPTTTPKNIWFRGNVLNIGSGSRRIYARRKNSGTLPCEIIYDSGIGAQAEIAKGKITPAWGRWNTLNGPGAAADLLPFVANYPNKARLAV